MTNVITGVLAIKNTVQLILIIETDKDIVTFLGKIHHWIALKVEPVFGASRVHLSGVIPSNASLMFFSFPCNRKKSLILRTLQTKHPLKLNHAIKLMLMRAFGARFHSYKSLYTSWLEKTRSVKHCFSFLSAQKNYPRTILQRLEHFL